MLGAHSFARLYLTFVVIITMLAAGGGNLLCMAQVDIDEYNKSIIEYTRIIKKENRMAKGVSDLESRIIYAWENIEEQDRDEIIYRDYINIIHTIKNTNIFAYELRDLSKSINLANLTKAAMKSKFTIIMALAKIFLIENEDIKKELMDLTDLHTVLMQNKKDAVMMLLGTLWNVEDKCREIVRDSIMMFFGDLMAENDLFREYVYGWIPYYSNDRGWVFNAEAYGWIPYYSNNYRGWVFMG